MQTSTQKIPLTNSDKKTLPSQETSLKVPTSYVNILSPSIQPSKFSKNGSLRFESLPKKSSDFKIISKGSNSGNSEGVPTVVIYTDLPLNKQEKLLKKNYALGETTFSDLIDEVGTLKTVITRAKPLFKSELLRASESGELALYGKDINVTRAVLAKEIKNYHNTNTQARTDPIKSTKLNKIKKRTAYKHKDISALSKKYMKVSPWINSNL